MYIYRHISVRLICSLCTLLLSSSFSQASEFIIDPKENCPLHLKKIQLDPSKLCQLRHKKINPKIWQNTSASRAKSKQLFKRAKKLLNDGKFLCAEIPRAMNKVLRAEANNHTALAKESGSILSALSNQGAQQLFYAVNSAEAGYCERAETKQIKYIDKEILEQTWTPTQKLVKENGQKYYKLSSEFFQLASEIRKLGEGEQLPNNPFMFNSENPVNYCNQELMRLREHFWNLGSDYNQTKYITAKAGHELEQRKKDYQKAIESCKKVAKSSEHQRNTIAKLGSGDSKHDRAKVEKAISYLNSKREDSQHQDHIDGKDLLEGSIQGSKERAKNIAQLMGMDLEKSLKSISFNEKTGESIYKEYLETPFDRAAEQFGLSETDKVAMMREIYQDPSRVGLDKDQLFSNAEIADQLKDPQSLMLLGFDAKQAYELSQKSDPIIDPKTINEGMSRVVINTARKYYQIPDEIVGPFMAPTSDPEEIERRKEIVMELARQERPETWTLNIAGNQLKYAEDLALYYTGTPLKTFTSIDDLATRYASQTGLSVQQVEEELVKNSFALANEESNKIVRTIASVTGEKQSGTTLLDKHFFQETMAHASYESICAQYSHVKCQGAEDFGFFRAFNPLNATRFVTDPLTKGKFYIPVATEIVTAGATTEEKTEVKQISRKLGSTKDGSFLRSMLDKFLK